MKIIAVLAVVVAVVVGAIALTMLGGGSEESTATGTEVTTNPPGTTQQSGGGAGGTPSLDISGTWSGDYQGNYGGGDWTWVIAGDGHGGYVGCIKVGGIYASEDWLPVTVTLQGNHITVGTVAGNAVVFDGTVEGNSASGTWRFTNNMDSGSWSGHKVNSDTSLPCQASGGGEGTTTMPYTETYTTTETAGEYTGTTTVTETEETTTTPQETLDMEVVAHEVASFILNFYGVQGQATLMNDLGNETFYIVQYSIPAELIPNYNESIDELFNQLTQFMQDRYNMIYPLGNQNPWLGPGYPFEVIFVTVDETNPFSVGIQLYDNSYYGGSDVQLSVVAGTG